MSKITFNYGYRLATAAELVIESPYSFDHSLHSDLIPLLGLQISDQTIESLNKGNVLYFESNMFKKKDLDRIKPSFHNISWKSLQGFMLHTTKPLPWWKRVWAKMFLLTPPQSKYRVDYIYKFKSKERIKYSNIELSDKIISENDYYYLKRLGACSVSRLRSIKCSVDWAVSAADIEKVFITSSMMKLKKISKRTTRVESVGDASVIIADI